MKRSRFFFLLFLVVLTGCGPYNLGMRNGRRALKDGEYYTAIQDFEFAIDEALKACGGNIGIGLAYYYMEKYDKALSRFNRMLREDFDCPEEVFFYRSFVWIKTNQYDSFVRDRNRHFSLANYGPKTRAQKYHRLGYFWLREDAYDTAILHFNRAIELDTGVTKYWKHRAIAHFRKGNLEQALEDINQVIPKDNKAHEAYYLRSQLRQKWGEPQQALKDARRALNIKKQEKYKGWLEQLKEYQRRGEPETMFLQAPPINLQRPQLLPPY